MTRTLKALGLALLAACALSAVAASSASAVDKITCTGQTSCDITSSDTTATTTFGTKSSSISITCQKENFSATVLNEATSVTVAPTYEECNSTVDVNGCDYILTGETTTHNKTTAGTETDARVKLRCPANQSIKITAFGCTISIGQFHGATEVNQNLHGVTYDNEGTPASTEDIKVTITVDSIAYTTSGGLCGAVGLPATGTDGTLTGTATAKGYLDNSAHGTSDHVGIAMDTA